MNRLELLKPAIVFAAVVERGSFKAAADFLNLSPPYVSQMISDLELRLGRPLMYRTTRKWVLTEAGEQFFPYALSTAEAFREGIELVSSERQRLFGRLCVAVPSVLAKPRFARIVNRFTREHPDIELKIMVGDEHIDTVDSKVDLIIRIGKLSSSNPKHKKLFDTQGIICCAPSLSERIRSIEDLIHLLWLKSPNMDTSFELRDEDDHTHKLAPNSTLVSNNEALIQAILAEGDSFAIFPAFVVQDALKQKVLINPLPSYSTETVPVYAVITEHRTKLSNAKAFLNAIIKDVHRSV